MTFEKYQKLFGDGSRLGMKIKYKIQKKPRGLVDAFILGSKFIGNDDVCLILGDNIFYGDSFSKLLSDTKETVEQKKCSYFYFSCKKSIRLWCCKNKKIS